MPKSKRKYTDTDRAYQRGKQREYREGSRSLALPTISRSTYEKRCKLEADPALWLPHYWPNIYYIEFSSAHLTILEKTVSAFRDRGKYAVAMRRGGGKTAVSVGAAIHALITGSIGFLLMVSKTSGQAAALLDDVYAMICQEGFAADYPEIAYPFVQSKGTWQTLRTYTDAETGDKVDAEKTREYLRFPRLPIRLDDGTDKRNPGRDAVLYCSGLEGNALRGAHVVDKDGRWRRPQGAICDDPQTDESAKSETQTEVRHQLITQTVAGTAGRGEKVGIVVPCTIIQRGDLADRLLDREKSPEFRGDVFPSLESMPSDAAMQIWEGEYSNVRMQGIQDEDAAASARRYYAEHRDEMDDGAKAGDENDITAGCVSAVQSAMDTYLSDRAFFWSEWQNQPEQLSGGGLYDLTADMVAVHSVPVKRLAVPSHMRVLVGHIDINRAGLHWAIMAAAQGQTCHVCAYGKMPDEGDLWEENAPEATRRKSIYDGLAALIRVMADMDFRRGGKRVMPQLVLVDRGYEAETVMQFAMSCRAPFEVLPDWGRGASKYRVSNATLVGQPFEGAHVTDGRLGRYLLHNSDFWRETAQRSFLGEPGSPGGCTLYAGGARMHRRFAEHICAEQLLNKYTTDMGVRWEWTANPANHDFLDNLTGCYVAAAVRGISSGETALPLQRRRKRPKRVSKVIPK